MKHYIVLAFIASAILTSCNQNTPPVAEQSTEKSNTLNPPTQMVVPTENTSEEATIEPTPPQNVQVEHIKDKAGNSRVQYSISEATIDSLNEIEPTFDKAKFNPLTINYFSVLADSLHGRPFYVSSANAVSETVMDILSTRLNKGTDIVFLIDKTASMDDDIEAIKHSLHQIMNHLSNYQNVKVGIACYGDLNYHYQLWYNHVDLTTNYEKLETFLDEIKTIGNPDDAESVNDGIVRTVESMHWTPGNRRLMLVIGDAPSQLPPYSRFSNNDVIKKCSEMNVLFNLYPVVISTRSNYKVASSIVKDFVQVGPNPASEFITLHFNASGVYTYEVNDLMGNKVQSGIAQYPEYTIQLNSIPDGKYLLQVMGRNGMYYYSTPFIIAH